MFDMEAINNFSVDKRKWKKVKFGDLAFEPKESIKDIVAAGIEHVVGLEHIDSEDIRLRRSSSIEESTTFTKKFTKGDVLFGRRRAYLKKAARADFEGICSGDIVVMRSREELLLPDLLPFIVNNDNFFDYAITHSAGGLSPRVKFKDLSNFELTIPPIDIQPKVLGLLISSLANVESFREVLEHHNRLIMAYRMDVFSRSHWPTKKLKYFFEVQLGKMLSAKARVGDNPSYYLANQNVQWGRIDLKKVNVMDFNEKEKIKFSLKCGDLLVCEGGEVGRTAIWQEQLADCYYQKALHRLRVKDNSYLPSVMLNFMYWGDSQGIFIGRTGHTTIAHLTAVKFKEIDVPDIPLNVQYEIEQNISALNDTHNKLEDHINVSAGMMKVLVNRIF